AGPLGEAPMWLVGAIPEAERLLGGLLIQKGREVGGVVDIAHAVEGRLGLDLAEFRAGGIAWAGLVPVARPPALAGGSDGVTGLLKQVGVDQILGREGTGVGAGVLDHPGVTAGEDGRAARAATRRGREGVVEERALARNA